MGKIYTRQSEGTRPTDATVDSIITELDTEDRYRYNQYGRWELIPQIGYKTKRRHTLFIPKNHQSHLIFGEASWQNINIELHSNGCMVYYARTLAASSGVPDEDPGYIILNDFAQGWLLPKMQVIARFSDLTSSSHAIIGIRDDATTVLTTYAAFIPNDVPCVLFGYKGTNPNFYLYHNDNSGAVVEVDTGIVRDTEPRLWEIEWETSTSVRATIYSIDGEVEYENTLTTNIPDPTIDLGFALRVINNDYVARYGIAVYDYIRLEKNKAEPDGGLDY